MAVNSCKMPKERIREGNGAPVRVEIAAKDCLYLAKRPLGSKAMMGECVSRYSKISQHFLSLHFNKNFGMLARKIRISKYSFPYRPVHYQRLHYIIRFSSTSTAHAPLRVLADGTPAATTKWTTTKSVQREDRHRPSAQHPSTRTAHIRFWEPVCSVVDVWVVKRALEKRFGAILETHFLKVGFLAVLQHILTHEFRILKYMINTK